MAILTSMYGNATFGGSCWLVGNISRDAQEMEGVEKRKRPGTTTGYIPILACRTSSADRNQRLFKGLRL
jgi:hypothetical protein